MQPGRLALFGEPDHTLSLYVNAVDTCTFGLCYDSDDKRGAGGKRTTKSTHPTSCRCHQASVAATEAPSVRDDASHDDESTDGAWT